MKPYKIQVETLSDALIHSGEGFGATIDADIVFDDLGIPYIPARRVKGCLRDAAHEVCTMLQDAGIQGLLDVTSKNENGVQKFTLVEMLFGMPGQKEPCPLFFSNLTIDDYEKNREWMRYFFTEYPNILTREGVIDTFTAIRQQTRINDQGIAEDNSLRTLRVLKKGKIFKGEITPTKENDDMGKLLALACLHFRHMGTRRNRGFGEISCTLCEDEKEVPVLKYLEALCTD